MVGGALGSPLAAVGLPLAAPAALYARLHVQRAKRIKKITEQMPRALEVLVLTLRSGNALPRAISAVAEEMAEPLRGELRRVVDEHRLGRPIEETFASLAERLKDCMPVRVLVTSILVLGQTGGNLIEVIERIIETIAAEEQYQQRISIGSAESRMAALILTVLPPIGLAYRIVTSSEARQLFLHDTIGHLMLVVSGLFWLLGIYFIRRLTRPAHLEQ
jgi:tight adherence protein B